MVTKIALVTKIYTPNMKSKVSCRIWLILFFLTHPGIESSTETSLYLLYSSFLKSSWFLATLMTLARRCHSGKWIVGSRLRFMELIRQLVLMMACHLLSKISQTSGPDLTEKWNSCDRSLCISTPETLNYPVFSKGWRISFCKKKKKGLINCCSQ